MVIPSQSAYLGTATYLRCTLDTNASPIIVPFLMGHFRPLLSSNILPFQNVAKDKKYSKVGVGKTPLKGVDWLDKRQLKKKRR